MAVGEKPIGEPQQEADGNDDLSGEQLIELEFNQDLDEREAARIYGDVQPQHCRLLRMGADFYVWALESRIGTVVDGRKFRQTDGPIPIRDGGILAVGKYLLYCEVGEAASLQQRRKRLLEGENFWKIMKASLPKPRKIAVQPKEDSELQCKAEDASKPPQTEVASLEGSVVESTDGDTAAPFDAPTGLDDIELDNDEDVEDLDLVLARGNADVEKNVEEDNSRKRKRDLDDSEAS